MWYDKWILFFKNKLIESGNLLYDNKDNPILGIILLSVVYYTGAVIISSSYNVYLLVIGCFISIILSIITYAIILLVLVPIIEWLKKSYKFACEGKVVKSKWRKQK